MALAFFLPVSSIYYVDLTPVRVAMSGGKQLIGIAPTYAGAAVLVVAIALASRARAAAAVASVAAVITIASDAYVVSTSTLTSRLVFELVPVAFAAFVAAAAWWRAFGTRRLERLVDAYVLASVPMVVLNYEASSRVGAYIFVGAWALLAGIRLGRAGVFSRCVEALRAAHRGPSPERRPAR